VTKIAYQDAPKFIHKAFNYNNFRCMYIGAILAIPTIGLTDSDSQNVPIEGGGS